MTMPSSFSQAAARLMAAERPVFPSTVNNCARRPWQPG
jgi:hypothetical protein